MTLWILIAGLLLLASLFVLYPFVPYSFMRKQKTADQNHALDTNLAIFYDNKAQLDIQLDNQQIDQAQYQQLIAEAQQLLLSDTAQTQHSQSTSGNSRAGLWLLPLLLIAIPAISLSLYKSLGASADQYIAQLIQLSTQSAAHTAADAELREQLHRALQQRVKQRPDNIYYWAMLAKQAIDSGDLQVGSDYFAKAIEIAPNDGYLLAQYAETLFMLADSQFTPAVIEALDRAFAIDSSNPRVLGLKGIQAFENKQWQLAVTYWQGAIQQVDQNSASVSALQAGIARANSSLGQAPTDSAIPAVKILLSIDPSIKYRPEQSVFVALVPTSGSPMPVAARKLRAGDLPLSISLGDADALMAGHNLSSVTQVKAIARLSQTGSATPQAGDWEAAAQVIELGSLQKKIVLRIIDQRL